MLMFMVRLLSHCNFQVNHVDPVVVARAAASNLLHLFMRVV